MLNVDERVLRSLFKYSLGRMTYVTSVTHEAIKTNVEILSNSELARLRSLIFYSDNLGQPGIDDITWKKTQSILEDEIHRRIQNNILIPERANKIKVDETVLGFAARGALKSAANDFIYIINEYLAQLDFLSLKNISLTLRDIEDYKLFGTKIEHLSAWLGLSELLKQKYLEKNNVSK